MKRLIGSCCCMMLAIVIISAAAVKNSVELVPSRGSDAPQLSPLAQQLIDYEKALPEAQKKKDVEFYKRTLTEDFVAIGTDAKVHTRAEILGDLPSIELVEYRPYNIDVIPLNDGAAVVTYDVIIQMAKYDEDTPRYQHISSIWVKQGEQWKLKFQQASAAQ